MMEHTPPPWKTGIVLMGVLMMFFKSKCFWGCTALALCALAFFVVVNHLTKPPQEVIRVYKAVELPQHRTRQEPAAPLRSDSVSARSDSVSAEIDGSIDTWNEGFLGREEEQTTEAFTSTSDALFTEEKPAVDSVDARVPGVDPNVAPAAGGPDAAQQLARIRGEIPKMLQERFDLLDLVEELALSNGAPPKLAPLREGLREDSGELRGYIFSRVGDYFRYTNDMSPFKSGGEFYDFLVQNNMNIKRLDGYP